MIDPRNFYFHSGYEIDKIIGTFEDTIFIGAPTALAGHTTVTTSYAHGFGDSTYFQGVFSTDGDVTTNDFGAQTPNLAPSFPQFQTLDAAATVDTTNANVTLTNYYDVAHSTSVPFTVHYKIYLLAKNTMSTPVNPLPSAQQRYFNSDFNYQKIAFKGSTTLTVTATHTGSAAVTHGLGYVPTVRAFWLDAATPTVVQAIPFDVEVHLTTTTLTFYSDQTSFGAAGRNGTIEYRIYYDD